MQRNILDITHPPTDPVNTTDSDTAATETGADAPDTVRLVIPDSIDLVEFFGPGEANLRALERSFDDLDIHVRANQVQAAGGPKRVEEFVNVIGELKQHHDVHHRNREETL